MALSDALGDRDVLGDLAAQPDGLVGHPGRIGTAPVVDAASSADRVRAVRGKHMELLVGGPGSSPSKRRVARPAECRGRCEEVGDSAVLVLRWMEAEGSSVSWGCVSPLPQHGVRSSFRHIPGGRGRPTLVTVRRRAAATLPFMVVLPYVLSSFLMTYREILYDLALENNGYVTTADARELGVPPGELSKLAARRGLTSVGYGVYRFDDAPGSPHDQYHEAVPRVGEGAHLTRDAVLALHDLALVNPRRIRVGPPRRTEAKLPGWIEVVREDIPTEDLTSYHRIRSTTVARALIDCQGIMMRDRLLEALDDAVRRGLVRRRGCGRVESAIKDNA